MGQEIERKFLVRGEEWREGARVVRCRQGYLVSEIGRTIRVRLAGDRAFLTIKGKTEGLARSEYEYAIPVEDAHEFLARFVRGRIVEKNRYTVTHAGTTWEVDEFLGENTGLIVAEVELESEDQGVDLPGWVGAEVTHDPRYLNVLLAKQPYLTWGSASRPADPVSREPEAPQAIQTPLFTLNLQGMGPERGNEMATHTSPPLSPKDKERTLLELLSDSRRDSLDPAEYEEDGAALVAEFFLPEKRAQEKKKKS